MTRTYTAQVVSDRPPSAPPAPVPLGTAEEQPTREHEVRFSQPLSDGRASPVPLGLEVAPTTASHLSISTPLERGSMVGRYMILARLGEGGMGVVYAAFDPELRRAVAIKLLRAVDSRFGSPEEQQARLLREAQAMAKISHPHVISVYDVGTYGDGVFVALEFVDGVTLREWIRERSHSWREILDVFRKAGRGLAAAHAVGLVHRDFKPENVLVGKDGRVRVTDFGLVRMAAEGIDAPSPQRSSAESSRVSSDRGQLTLAGVVMGTPKYMPPEQHAGGVADARSDQFAFCAALYWGLYRKRPFDHRALAAATAAQRKRAQQAPGPTRVYIGPGKSETGLSGAALQALLREPPRTPRLPKPIRRALMRGLSMSPEERFAGMEALLAALDDQPALQRRRLLAVAGACAALVVAPLIGYSLYLAARERHCNSGPERLVGIWDPSTRETMDRAIRTSGAEGAVETAEKVHQAIDRYSRGWVEMYADACRATRVRGEQTEHVLSLRMGCLDRRLQEVRALVGVLTSADEKLVEKAAEAAYGLQGLKPCADVEALTTQVTMPEDPDSRAQIEKVSTLLAEVKALHGAGMYRPAQELAAQALKLAGRVRFRPLEAEALYWHGWLQALTGADVREAERSLVQAVYAARAGRDDLTQLRASVKLLYVLGALAARYDDAHFWEGMIRADLERIGGNEELESQMLSNLGSVLILERRHAEAERAFERALQLADDSERGKILSDLSIVYLEEKRYDLVIRTARESLDLIARTRGPDHVSAAYAHEVLGRAYRGKKDFGYAHVEIERALAMYRRSLGPTHRQVSDGMDALAELLRAEERFAEAVEVSHRALELKEKAIGPDHPDLACSLLGLGQGYLDAGQAARSIPLFERALKLSPKDRVKQAEVSFGLARATWATGQDRARSRALARQALDTFRQRGDVEDAGRVAGWLDSPGGSGSKKTARR